MATDVRTAAQIAFDAALEAAYRAYLEKRKAIEVQYPPPAPPPVDPREDAIVEAEAAFEAAKRAARVAYDAARKT